MTDPREIEALVERMCNGRLTARGDCMCTGPRGEMVLGGSCVGCVTTDADIAALRALVAQLAAARAEVERLRRNTPTCGVCDNEAVLIVIGSKQREGKARLVRMMRCLTCWEKMNQSLYRTVPLAAIDAAKGGA